MHQQRQKKIKQIPITCDTQRMPRKRILLVFYKIKPISEIGILRYKVDFQSLQADEPLDDVDLDDY